jgi:hypothetical protein
VSLEVVVTANIPEILREAGPAGASLIQNIIHTLFPDCHLRVFMSRISATSVVSIPAKLVSKPADQIIVDYQIYGPGRVLRYVTTNHIFREISPDVFANNRVSSVLDTGKSMAGVKAE